MKLVVLLIGLSFFTFGQNPIGKSFHGQKDGASQSFYNNGQIRDEFTIVNGEIHGTQTSYFKNGKIMTIANYNFGYFNGLTTYFDKKGRIISKCIFHNDTLIECCELAYYLFGNYLLSKTIYKTDKNSLKNVSPKTFSHNQFGEYSTFDVLRIKKDPDVVKLDSVFYKNKSLWYVEKYKNNKKNGEFIQYNKVGVLLKKECYLDGEKINCL